MEENQEETKIAVCVAWDSPFIWTAPSFNMMNWERPDGCQVRFFMGVGWCPAARHNDLVAKAQEWGADLVMFNGGDHLCPFDILPRMLARIKEGWDIVQAMIPSRGVCGRNFTPFKALSYKVVGPMPADDAILHAPRGSVDIISYEDEPQEVHISGTGNIMMKAEIFDGLQKPYFEEFIKKDGLYGRYCVQDSHFVYRCTVESGAKMFCDTSIKLIHLDVFGIDETYSDRFKDKTGVTDWSPAKDLKKFV
jgi:hypothetical protein